MSLNTALVQESFALFERNPNELIRAFLDILLSKHPTLRRLFDHSNVDNFQESFFRALGLAIKHLNDPEALESQLLDIGLSHARRGVRQEYFSPVCEAMLEAMALVAGDHWSRELEEAWDELLGVMAAILKSVIRHSEMPVR